MFISLRYKFIFIISVLLVSSISTFLYLAIELFNSDKKAYIYDNNAALVDAFSEEIMTGFQSVIKTLHLVGFTYNEEKNIENKQSAIQKLFVEEPSLVDLSIFELSQDQLGAVSFHLVNQPLLNPFNLKAEYLQRVLNEKPIDLKAVLKQKQLIQNASLEDGIPLTRISVLISSNRLVVAHVDQDRQLQMFKRSSVYTSYLIDQEGRLIAHRDHQKAIARENFSKDPAVQDVISSQVISGVREYKNPGNEKIVAYRRLSPLNLIVVSEVPTKLAFAASARLIEKSVLFAILILSVAFVTSILFTRKLTAALHRLFIGTERIGHGDFTVAIPVQSKDEVGSLSNAFNKMTGEITRLLKETADKARMEKEFETAQMVQDQFFPPADARVGDFEISSFYKPASECGGDWWGHFQVGNQLVIMIGDATGHGMGAALITAATKSCASTLEWLHKNKKIQNISPSFLMSSLNASVFETGKNKIKMTFFVGMIDLNTGEMKYCNASHHTPIVCKSAQDETNYKDLIEPLLGESDPCLGQDLQAIFREHSITLQNSQSIVFHTDGIIELQNASGEEFGERRFMKSIAKAAVKATDEMRSAIMNEVSSFQNLQHLADDLTLVVVRRHASKERGLLAS